MCAETVILFDDQIARDAPTTMREDQIIPFEEAAQADRAFGAVAVLGPLAAHVQVAELVAVEGADNISLNFYK